MPPVAVPVGRTADADIYSLTQREQAHEIIPGLQTPIWGYDGMAPGPTIAAEPSDRSDGSPPRRPLPARVREFAFAQRSRL